jgi:raffinose/stachyose/melibiose transport system substrate-binding protein
MHGKRIQPLVALIVIAAIALTSCAPSAPAAPAATPAPAAAQPAAAEPTAAPAAAEATAAPEPTVGATDAVTTTDQVVDIQAGTQITTELEGQIVISLQSNDVQTYQALADAYMKLHPKVKVLVELKAPGGEDSYLQWIRTQFSAGTPRVSILESNHLLDLVQEGRLIDWAPYLNKINPYTGQKWEDGYDTWGLNLARDTSTGDLFYLPYMSNQTFWVYNKDIFKKAGITDVPAQPTWSQFVDWCKKIKAAGYICIAQEGKVDSIWGGGKLPWLMRSAMDQYHRADIKLARCQPGDWCYRDGIDDKWQYDPTNPRNDDPDQVSINVVRHLIALQDKTISFDNACTADMMDKIGEIYKTENGFVPDGWLGISDAYPLFLTQKAAMRQDTGRVYTQLAKDIKSLAAGSYADTSAVSTDQAKAATDFEFGTFAFPTMEGPCVQGKARANELPSGYLAVPKKDRKQNDLEVDFVMFWTSPQGMQIYLNNKLDDNNLQGGIQGPTIIKGVQLPAKWADIFSHQTFIGNYEKAGAPADKEARGFYMYEPTKREWAIMVQDFFNGKITSQEFATKYEKLLQDNWDGLLQYLNVTPDDLAHPEKRPPKWVGGGPY